MATSNEMADALGIPHQQFKNLVEAEIARQDGIVKELEAMGFKNDMSDEDALALAEQLFGSSFG